jgi:hypothetical protein
MSGKLATAWHDVSTPDYDLWVRFSANGTILARATSIVVVGGPEQSTITKYLGQITDENPLGPFDTIADAKTKVDVTLWDRGFTLLSKGTALVDGEQRTVFVAKEPKCADEW